MAIDDQTPALRYAFATRTTTLATATTIAAATRHDFAAITVWAPLSRSFARASGGRVFVRVTGYAPTNTSDVDVIRIGIKINAVAFDDLDHSIAIVNSGNHINFERWRDVTDYFATNDPATASFSVQVGIAVAQGVAGNVANLTAELFMVAGYDTAVATKRYATLVFPIQSHHQPPANDFVTYQEVGALGAAPVANQIKQLTGVGGEFDGVDGLSIKARYLIVTGMSNLSSVGYPVDMRSRFDAAAHTTLPFGVTATITSNRMTWMVDMMALSTTAAHTWSIVTGMSLAMENVGGLEVVTVEYDETSDTHLVHQAVPLENPNASETSYPIRNTTAADADRLVARFDVQEPSPVMLRSGVMLSDGMFTGGADTILAAPGQTERTYDRTTTGTRTGFAPIIHRCDHSGSTWSTTFARGRNELSVDLRTGSLQANMNPTSGIALINYRCGRHAGGGHKHARTMPAAMVVTYAETVLSTFTPEEPVIVSPNYTLSGAFVEHIAYAAGRMAQVGAQRQATEDSGKGWARSLHMSATNIAEISDSITYHPNTTWWRRRAGAPVGMDLETERKWLGASTDNAIGHVAIQWLVIHSMTFTVTGVVEIDSIPVAFAEVDIFAVDADGVAELVASVVADGAGAFTAEVPDDTRDYFATHSVGRSDLGVPDVDTFDVSINSPSAPPPTDYDVKITTRPGYVSTSASATFAWTASAGTVEVSVDGGAYAVQSSPLNLAGLADGAHTVIFRSAQDHAETHTEAWTVDTSGGGGGDTTPPVVTIISPAVGPIGTPGGFSSNWNVARMTPLIIEIKDLSPGLLYQCLVIRYVGSPEQVVYRRGAFRGDFLAYGSATAITDGVRLSILPATGWPTPEAINTIALELDAVDADGNLAP